MISKESEWDHYLLVDRLHVSLAKIVRTNEFLGRGFTPLAQIEQSQRKTTKDVENVR